MAKKFSVEAIFSAADKMTAPLAGIRSKLDKFGRDASKSLAAFDKRLGAVRAGLKSIATATLAAGTVGGAAAFAIAKTGAEFEQAITAVAAVSLMTRDQIADLEAEAERLGATTQFTATQAANAMETMARAGFTNAEILAGVGAVLNGAAAEGIEIAEMASHVSNALKGMGLETTETTRVADVLALASARTNSSIASLGESLANTASTARQFKIPLEDVVAGVALLQDVGLDASVAGSAMNTMLTQMSAPTDSLKKKMKQWGVTFKDAQGNMLPFQDVLANISLAAKKAGGNMDQVAFMAELVGMRGEKAASNLSNLFNTGKVQALTKELQGAAGAAKKMADTRMNTTIGDLTILGSAIDGVKNKLFKTQSGPLRAVIQSMTKWVEANQQLIVSEFQAWVQWLSDHLPEIAIWTERIAKALAAFMVVSGVVKVLGLLATTLNAILWVAGALSTAFAWLQFTALLLGTTIGALALPILLVGAAIAGLVALAYAYWPEITAFFSGLYDAAVEAVGGIWEWIKGAFDTVKGYVVAIFEFLVGLLSIVFAPGIAAIKEYVSVAGAWFDFLVGLVKSIWSPLTEWWGTFWDGIVAVQASYFDAVVGVWSKLGGFFTGVWDAIASAFWRVVGPVVDAAKGVINVIRTAGRIALGTADSEDGAVTTVRPAPQVISPQERAAAATAEAVAGEGARVDGRIVVEAKPGTKASVKQKPSRVPLELEPSGAFP